MPLLIAATAKSALMLGATIGFTVAVISNDRVIELTAEILQKGADCLNEHLKKKANKIARCPTGCDRMHTKGVCASEATTPSVTDDEYDDETDVENCNGGEPESRVRQYRTCADDILSVQSLD